MRSKTKSGSTKNSSLIKISPIKISPFKISPIKISPFKISSFMISLLLVLSFMAASFTFPAVYADAATSDKPAVYANAATSGNTAPPAVTQSRSAATSDKPAVYANAATSVNIEPPVDTQSRNATSYGNNFAIKSDGSMWAWGRNKCGEVGDGTMEPRNTAVKVLDDVSVAYRSDFRTYAIKKDGSLWRWGIKDHITSLDKSDFYDLLPVKLMDGVYDVLHCETTVFVVMNDHTLWAWNTGYNSYIALGNGADKTSNAPVKIMGGVSSIIAGDQSVFVIDTEDGLWSWGYGNSKGVLGNGTQERQLSPQKILDGVKSVSISSSGVVFHALAIKKDGSLWAWGYNEYGQLGDGSAADSYTPKKIMDDVSAASLGKFFSCAIKTDGSLWTWGTNEHGELGNGSVSPSGIPVKIMEDVKSVTAMAYYAYAVKKDGSLWSWGKNDNGVLGDGKKNTYDKEYEIVNNNSNIPVKIADGVVSVYAYFKPSEAYAYALKKDGSIWRWGKNDGNLCDPVASNIGVKDILSPAKLLDGAFVSIDMDDASPADMAVASPADMNVSSPADMAVASPTPLLPEYETVRILFDGRYLDMDQPPVIVNDRTLVPVAVIAKALGATADWDADKEEVTIVKDYLSIKLTIGSTLVYVNGIVSEIDVPVQIIGWRTMVPVKFVATYLGADVSWDDENRVVVITTGSQP